MLGGQAAAKREGDWGLHASKSESARARACACAAGEVRRKGLG